MDERPKNIFGEDLKPCCFEPKTGWFRDGYCNTGPYDTGLHLVCTIVTKEFLEFSSKRGNDLTTPNPGSRFPGLKPGDKWCLCISRWKEALDHGVAPPVILESTHSKALEIVPLDIMIKYAKE